MAYVFACRRRQARESIEQIMNNVRLTMVATAGLNASPGEEAAGRIEELRRQLGVREAAAAGKCGVLLALGNPAIDGALGGGLGCGALHEIAAVREADVAAASGFALALAVRRAARRGGPIGNSWDARKDARVPSTVLWIAEDLLLGENGALYGPGLEAIGIAPERLITVAAVRGRDVLWAMEEALRCRAVGMVIGEMRPRGIDQVATRRLALPPPARNALGPIPYNGPGGTPSAPGPRRRNVAAPGAPRCSRRVPPPR